MNYVKNKLIVNVFGHHLNDIFLFLPFNKKTNQSKPIEYKFIRLKERECCNTEKTGLNNFLTFVDQKKEFSSKDELGRATWKILHSISYDCPINPSSNYKNDMKLFLNLFARFYPCEHCKIEFSDYLKLEPPQLNSRSDFINWVCRFYNSINQKLGKNNFNCSKLLELYK